MGTPTMVFTLTLFAEGEGNEHTEITTTSNGETFGEDVNQLEHEALAAEEPSNPILPVGPELIWGAACFLALWALMKFVLLKPVVKLMTDRDEKVAGDIAAAEQAKVSVTTVLDDYHTSLTATRAEANRLVEDARAQGEARRRELIAAAESEAGAIRSSAAEEVTAAKAEALAGLRGDVATIATEAASVVVGRTLDPAAQQGVVDQYLTRS